MIYEGAPAEYIGTGFVDTPHGRIRATHTIRATEGYTPTCPGCAARSSRSTPWSWLPSR